LFSTQKGLKYILFNCGNAFSKEEIEEFNEGTFDEDDD